MNVEVDTKSPVPAYEQIRSQVTSAVLTGALTPGTRLPTIRQLAGDLSLAANTVARAYRELESDAVVITAGKRGTFIADHPGRPTTGRHTEQERRRVLHAAANSYAAAAHSLGYNPQEAIHELREVMTTPATTPAPTSVR